MSEKEMFQTALKCGALYILINIVSYVFVELVMK